MIKKIIIATLVILIIASLGTIGYLFYSQNKTSLIGQTVNQVVKTVTQINPFPIATTTITPNTETDNSSLPDTQNNLDNPTTTERLSNQDLSQISVAGLAVLKIGNSLTTVFVDRSTGNFYSLDRQNNSTRLTNTTLSGVGKVYFGQNKNKGYVLLRQLKDNQINNLSGQLTLSTTSSITNMTTSPWPKTFYDFTVSPDKQKVFVLTKTDNGSTVALTTDFDLKTPKQVWTSPLTDWQVSWPTTNLIALLTKPASDYAGSLFTLDPSTSKVTRVLSNINGLTAKVSPDGKKLIYNRSLLSSFSLYQYNIGSGVSELLEFNTLVDKCVWSGNDILFCAVPKSIPAGRYPDDWYMGKVSFADDIWKIDLKQKITTQVAPLRGNYDLIDLTLNDETGWLYAINKNDNTLQAFSLNGLGG